MMTDKIVMYDSPEAAHKEFREIWVSRTGRISLDENAARYDGCTHKPCGKCGEPTRKPWTICDKCMAIAAVERYNAKEKKVWDGTGFVFSEAREQFYDENDLADLEADGECLAELMLVICDPVFGQPIEDDYFCDVLPEDGEVPDDIMDAVEVFNKAMEAYGPLSWYPGPYAMDVSAYLEQEEKGEKPE